MRKTFMDDVMAGQADASDIDYYIAAWMCADARMDMQAWLGFTDGEYLAWLQEGDAAIDGAVRERKKDGCGLGGLDAARERIKKLEEEAAKLRMEAEALIEKAEKLAGEIDGYIAESEGLLAQVDGKGKEKKEGAKENGKE